MTRIFERISTVCCLAPASVAASTETATDYVAAKGILSIDFHILLASLASGKTLTVALYSADDSTGANAEKVAETSFTAADAMSKVAAVVSIEVDAPYYCVKFQHDSASAVMCSAVCNCCGMYTSAQGWTLLA